MPEQLPPDDPITSRPMAGLVLISVFILMLSLPVKILLRLLLRIKYVWVTPWFSI